MKRLDSYGNTRKDSFGNDRLSEPDVYPQDLILELEDIPNVTHPLETLDFTLELVHIGPTTQAMTAIELLLELPDALNAIVRPHLGVLHSEAHQGRIRAPRDARQIAAVGQGRVPL